MSFHSLTSLATCTKQMFLDILCNVSAVESRWCSLYNLRPVYILCVTEQKLAHPNKSPWPQVKTVVHAKYVTQRNENVKQQKKKEGKNKQQRKRQIIDHNPSHRCCSRFDKIKPPKKKKTQQPYCLLT